MKPWFKEFGWIYIPISWQGYFVTLIFILFCLQVFISTDKLSHSASDTLYGIFPFIVPALIVLFWIASKTSRPKK